MDRIQTIFAQALRLAAAERENFLTEACKGEPELRLQVESLLQAHEQAGNFLREAALEPPTAVVAERAGTMIGRYKLLEKIGEGGFGVVWMAEQEEPVRRRVALKIIKLGMDTKEVVARFEAERQALAMMDHPNIASVFDGGATDTGRPYFVMELVKGIPITDYCDANKLTTPDRLRLFMQVCHAVQHANQKGVIHRDLKPSNILVTVKDDQPLPKVIDFGVAKATQARLTEKTLFTQFRQLIGTPAYMSPEQAGLGSLDVDTRSDVYSLGVLLYELLTGRPPFDTQKLLEKGYDAVMRTIREEEPPKPSTRLSTLNKEELDAVAAKRGAEPAKLNRIVHGDLDWIVMKALEKDRQRRYETASTFARDVQSYLEQEPVSAAAPNFFYVSGKFIRRNRSRLAFAGLAQVAAMLAIGGGRILLDNRAKDRAFQATGTNAVFVLAESGDAKALARQLDANPRLINEHDAEGSTPSFYAAGTGDTKALARQLDANPRLINERDAEGSTPLSYAAGAGATNTLRLLLARGAAVDATNHTGLTALGNAAANNQPAALVALLDAGADPNHADNSGATPLHAASLFGSVEMGRALLSKGARPDARALGTNLTPLHHAALAGYADFVELLLTYHARPDLPDASGNTALLAAACGRSTAGLFRDLRQKLSSPNDQETARQGMEPVLLEFSNRLVRLEAMITPDMQRSGGQHHRVAELLLAHQADLEATRRDGCTPLLTAALFTNVSVAEVLIAHGANLNARAKEGSTPLNLAALKGSVPLVELLLKAGANADLQDDTGFTPLNTAIEQEHPDVAKVLLLHRANPNLATHTGQTPMHTAASASDIETMRLLLDHNAGLHPLEIAGTPLSVAVQQHRIEAVKFLLQRGAKPDVAPPQNGMTSLHWAATLGQPDIVKLLLDAGANVDADSSWQGTPLNAAASGPEGAQKWLASAYAQFPDGAKVLHPAPGSEFDYVAVLRTLLAAKANVNAREPRYDRTPIFAAVSLGQAGAVDILLAAGADLKAADRTGRTPLHAASQTEAPAAVVSNIVTRLLRAGADVEARDQFRGTPLHAAANFGKPVMVELLLNARARINAVGPNLCTPLQLAVMHGSRDLVEVLLGRQPDLEWRDSSGTTALQQACLHQSQDLVALLLDHGSEVDAGTRGTTNNGTTALMFSANAGYLGMMKLLLDHGAQIELTNDMGMTALKLAAQAGQMDAAKLLLDHHAKFTADRLGNTPALTAARAGKLEMLKLLLSRGESLDERDNEGFTLLHCAADHGHAEVVGFLVGRGFAVNARGATGFTPLHCAANGWFTNEASYVAVVKVLLAHEANVNARTHQNQTPLHRAAGWGHPRILEALLSAGADPNARDDDGKSALDLATAPSGSSLRPGVAEGRKECAQLLVKALLKSLSPPNAKETKP